MNGALFIIVPMLFLDSLFEGTIFESKPEKPPEEPAEICAMLYGKSMSLQMAARRAEGNGQHCLSLNNYYKALMVLKNIQATDPDWNGGAVESKMEFCQRHVDMLESIVEEREKAYREELAKLQGAVEEDPLDPERHVTLADFYFNYGKPALAENCMRKALEIDPSSTENRVKLGNAYEAQADYVGAIREYRRVTAIDPVSANAHYCLGVALFKVQSPGPELSTSHKRAIVYPESVSELKKAIEIDPQFVEAYIYLGMIYNRQKQYKHALMALNQAYQLEPDNPVTNYNLGSTHCSLLNFVNATNYMNRAADLVGRHTEMGRNIRQQVTELRRYNLKGQEGRGYRDRYRMMLYKGRMVSGPKFRRWKRRTDRWIKDYQRQYHPPPDY